jgi:hypothetical protein
MAFSDYLRRTGRELAEILRPRDAQFTDLLMDLAHSAAKAGAVLLRYLASASPELAQEIAEIEGHGDLIQADIQRALREALVTPLSGTDINYLANAIDDLLDQFEDMVSEDQALAAAGIGADPYEEVHYGEVIASLGKAVSVLPDCVSAVLREPKAAQEKITAMRDAYNEGKRAYSLAYAALLQSRSGGAAARPENRLRWLRSHLRRVEKLANAFAGILANG